MRLHPLPILAAFLFLPGASHGQHPVTFRQDADRIRIEVGAKPFAEYVWKDAKILRPYFTRVHAPNGTVVTRNHPPVAGTDAMDHDTMHPGLWLAFGDLGGADFWRNKGTVTHVEFVEKPKPTNEGGSFAVRNRYAAGDRVLCEEVCRVSITSGPNGTRIDLASEFTAKVDFAFGDQEEMGLGVRVATPITVKNGGRILNGAGAKNEKETWGKTSEWCDYSGTIDGELVGVTLMPHPKNFRPSWFHSRDYGVLVANPFGRNAFTRGEKSQVPVRAGETFKLRFAVLVHSGKADIGAAYREWIAGRPRIEVSKDKIGFVRGGKPFKPWGFNYDHDEKGRLIEDYWDAEWPKVEADFAAMKALGANVVRVHLQLGKFMTTAETPNAKSLDRLGKLLALAEECGLDLDLTGLGCYHKADVPPWYDALAESDRWSVQARFWEAVAKRCSESPAVFCYDLMNEPVVSGGKRKDGDWLGPAFGGKHFVQFIALDAKGRKRPEVAKAWIERLVAAVRKVDARTPITVGLVDWSLDRPGLTSGFVPSEVCEKLDFVAVHLYPEAGKQDEATKTLRGFAVGKPVIVEETYPLKCSPAALAEFIAKSEKDAAGWIGFYWGRTPEELRRSKSIGDAIQLQWLETFQKNAPRE